MSPPLKCRWTCVQQAQECGTIASSGFNPVKLQKVHVSYCICQSYEKLSLGLKKNQKRPAQHLLNPILRSNGIESHQQLLAFFVMIFVLFHNWDPKHCRCACDTLSGAGGCLGGCRGAGRRHGAGGGVGKGCTTLDPDFAKLRSDGIKTY